MKKYQLNKDNILGVFGEGSESIVYLYKDKNGNKVAVKKFKDKFTIPTKTEDIPYETLLNKERKLLLLSQSKVIDEDTKPIDLYYENDKFVAYSMNIDKLDDMGKYYTSSKKTKLELLKKLKNKVELLNKYNIYIGDFNIENFGIREDGSIKLRDIDNFSVNGLLFDRPNVLVTNYMNNCSKIDNVDNYSFNYFSLSYLLSIHQRALTSYLKENGLPYRFDTKENRELLEELKNINDNYTKKYFIDNQKKGLLK